MPPAQSRTAAPPRKRAKHAPVLAMKKLPAQQRATETFERILEVAAQTLADVGVDRLSTNLICERAGLSPPALYRYFPNKYALLVELARRLMERQNELIPRWITAQALGGTPAKLQQALQGLVLDTYRVTRGTTGGLWITRALLAVPVLTQVRLESHAKVTQAQAGLLREAFPTVPWSELVLASRVSVEILYSAVEMLLDEQPMDAQEASRIVSTMTASYLENLQSAARRRRRGGREKRT